MRVELTELQFSMANVGKFIQP